MKTRLKVVKNFLKDPLKKNYFTIIKEFLTYSWRQKRFVKQYFTYFIYRKGAPSLDNFVDDRIIYRIWRNKELYPAELTKNLNNKLLFYEICQKNQINTPYLLAYNEKQQFFIEDKPQKITSFNDFQKLLTTLVKKEPAQAIFVKPIDGHQGENCYKITLEKLEDLALLETIFTQVIKSNFIFQRLVIQHPTVNLINKSSVNTIRFSVFIKDDGEVELLSAFMRVGQAGSEIDNITAGGYFVPIDLATGKFRGEGIQKLKTGYHPYSHTLETNILLDGYQLPDIAAAIALVKKAAATFQLRLTGWDLALAEDGPIIIEGNTSYGIGSCDLAYGGYMKHPVFLEVIDKFGQ